jgi:hypothetical protein
MKRSAPGSLTTLGVLHIVFGSLFSFCCLFGLVMNAADSPLFGDLDDDFVQAMIERDLPSYMTILLLIQGFGVLFFLVMLIAGIGMASKANWGRFLAIGNACAMVPYCLAVTVYTLAFEAPTITRMLRGNPFPGAQEANSFLWVGYVLRMLILLVFMIYAVITISILLGARVRGYFQQASFDMDRYQSDDEWDDIGRGRRDRRDWRDY